MLSFDSKNAQINKKQNFDTLFTNGLFTTETQITKYDPDMLPTSTGELIYCEGRNNLRPLNVLINPYIGPEGEMNDVDTESFQNLYSYLHPITFMSNMMFRITDWYNGIKVKSPANIPSKSIRNFSLKVSEMSIGQETDLASHQRKYEDWKEARPGKRLMLYGVSRGAATVFASAAKCPEAEIVILEGCFYSITDIIERSPFSLAKSIINSGLGLFTKYKPEGPSPNKYIKDFPAGIPVVFISSENDIVVPYASTKKLADELNVRGKNPVYLITLKKATHPNYMFDDADDHDKYERCIQAIYKKHGFPYDDRLAKLGEVYLEESLLKPPAPVTAQACATKPK